jgi:hypothetical protein
MSMEATHMTSENGSQLAEILGVGQKFPDEQQRAIDLMKMHAATGEHAGAEGAELLYALDVIVNLLRVEERKGSVTLESCIQASAAGVPLARMFMSSLILLGQQDGYEDSTPQQVFDYIFEKQMS